MDINEIQKLNKVYILLDSYAWNDESCIKIVAVTSSESKAKELLKEYVEKVKKEVDFDLLDIVDDDDDDGYIVNENENSFELYCNGYYDSNHISISIEEKELILDKKRENIQRDIERGR